MFLLTRFQMVIPLFFKRINNGNKNIATLTKLKILKLFKENLINHWQYKGHVFVCAAFSYFAEAIFRNSYFKFVWETLEKHLIKKKVLTFILITGFLRRLPCLKRLQSL